MFKSLKTTCAVSLLALIATPTLALDRVTVAFAGTENAAIDGEYVFIEAFAASLAEAGVETVVHANNTMGKEDERFDQTAQGLIEVNLSNPSMMHKVAPVSRVLYLPFLFESEAQLDAVVERSDLLSQINDAAINHGIRIAGFNMRGGQIGMFTVDTPVTHMADLEGLRLRAQNGEQVTFFESWGAQATVVSFAEVPNALQTGVASGYFNPASTALVAGHTDLLHQFSDMQSMPLAKPIMLSADWYDALDDAEKQIVDTAVAAGVEANRVWSVDYAEKAVGELEAKGVTVSTLAEGEREKFEDATSAVWDVAAEPADIEMIRSFIE